MKKEPTYKSRPGAAVVWSPRTQPIELRDYFAAAALNACIEDWRRDAESSGMMFCASGCAEDCYEIADAMIAAREETL